MKQKTIFDIHIFEKCLCMCVGVPGWNTETLFQESLLMGRNDKASFCLSYHLPTGFNGIFCFTKCFTLFAPTPYYSLSSSLKFWFLFGPLSLHALHIFHFNISKLKKIEIMRTKLSFICNKYRPIVKYGKPKLVYF